MKKRKIVLISVLVLIPMIAFILFPYFGHNLEYHNIFDPYESTHGIMLTLKGELAWVKTLLLEGKFIQAVEAWWQTLERPEGLALFF